MSEYLTITPENFLNDLESLMSKLSTLTVTKSKSTDKKLKNKYFNLSFCGSNSIRIFLYSCRMSVCKSQHNADEYYGRISITSEIEQVYCQMINFILCERIKTCNILEGADLDIMFDIPDGGTCLIDFRMENERSTEYTPNTEFIDGKLMSNLSKDEKMLLLNDKDAMPSTRDQMKNLSTSNESFNARVILNLSAIKRNHERVQIRPFAEIVIYDTPKTHKEKINKMCLEML